MTNGTFFALKSGYRDRLKMHLIVLVWGYTGILGKWSTLPAEALVFFRMLFAFVVMVLYARESLLRIERRELFCYLDVGGIIALHWSLFLDQLHFQMFLSHLLAWLPLLFLQLFLNL